MMRVAFDYGGTLAAANTGCVYQPPPTQRLYGNPIATVTPPVVTATPGEYESFIAVTFVATSFFLPVTDPLELVLMLNGLKFTKHNALALAGDECTLTHGTTAYVNANAGGGATETIAFTPLSVATTAQVPHILRCPMRGVPTTRASSALANSFTLALTSGAGEVLTTTVADNAFTSGSLTAHVAACTPYAEDGMMGSCVLIATLSTAPAFVVDKVFLSPTSMSNSTTGNFANLSLSLTFFDPVTGDSVNVPSSYIWANSGECEALLPAGSAAKSMGTSILIGTLHNFPVVTTALSDEMSTISYAVFGHQPNVNSLMQEFEYTTSVNLRTAGSKLAIGEAPALAFHYWAYATAMPTPCVLALILTNVNNAANADVFEVENAYQVFKELNDLTCVATFPGGTTETFDVGSGITLPTAGDTSLRLKLNLGGNTLLDFGGAVLVKCTTSMDALLENPDEYAASAARMHVLGADGVTRAGTVLEYPLSADARPGVATTTWDDCTGTQRVANIIVSGPEALFPNKNQVVSLAQTKHRYSAYYGTDFESIAVAGVSFSCLLDSVTGSTMPTALSLSVSVPYVGQLNINTLSQGQTCLLLHVRLVFTQIAAFINTCHGALFVRSVFVGLKWGVSELLSSETYRNVRPPIVQWEKSPLPSPLYSASPLINTLTVIYVTADRWEDPNLNFLVPSLWTLSSACTVTYTWLLKSGSALQTLTNTRTIAQVSAAAMTASTQFQNDKSGLPTVAGTLNAFNSFRLHMKLMCTVVSTPHTQLSLQFGLDATQRVFVPLARVPWAALKVFAHTDYSRFDPVTGTKSEVAKLLTPIELRVCVAGNYYEDYTQRWAQEIATQGLNAAYDAIFVVTPPSSTMSLIANSSYTHTTSATAVVYALPPLTGTLAANWLDMDLQPRIEFRGSGWIHLAVAVNISSSVTNLLETSIFIQATCSLALFTTALATTTGTPVVAVPSPAGSGDEWPVGSTITASCDTGYSFDGTISTIGDYSFTCSSFNVWTSTIGTLSTCVRVPVCLQKSFGAGVVTPTMQDMDSLDAITTASCDDGYTARDDLPSSAIYKCTQTGSDEYNWSLDVNEIAIVCVPHCIPIADYDPNIDTVIYSGNGEPALYNVATVTSCATGFMINPVLLALQCELDQLINSAWSQPASYIADSVCLRVACPVPFVDSTGTVYTYTFNSTTLTGTPTAFAETTAAAVSCLPEYELPTGGVYSTICDVAGWADAALTMCVPKTCPEFPLTGYSNVVASGTTSVVGDEFRPVCE